MPDISVVIPAYNEEQYLGACLESVLQHKIPEVKEIIVIDNASTDNTAGVAAKYPGVRVVREERKGLTRARQRGLETVQCEILAWIDADSRVDRIWFEAIRDTFDRHPEIVSLSGPYSLYDASITEKCLARVYWWILGLPIYYMMGYMVVGGNFAARREALLSIGGFDTSIEFYGEDTNIARRLKKAGKVIFRLDFINRSSARRMHEQGFLLTGLMYGWNFFSQALAKSSVTDDYVDVR